MSMEPDVRIRLKKWLSGIAVAMLGFQLIVVAIQQRSTPASAWINPTYASGSSTNVASSAASGSCSATVRTQQLNQRSGPGTDYAIVGGAVRGAQFSISGQDADRQWLLASTAAGTVWMSARYLTLEGDCDALPVQEARSAQVALAATAIPTQTSTTSAADYVARATTLSAVFTDEVQYWAAHILRWAATYQLDPNLIATVIQIESCGNATISSSAGAQGLFQVMPFHFSAGESMTDVETNARRGLDYLQGALQIARGDVALALAGYNGGHGVIYGRWAAETQRYSRWGAGIYAEASAGAASSATLQDWLSAGGASLCARARQSLPAV